jgi:Flp pilus assembly protein TadG
MTPPLLRILRSDRRGMALVEFALLLPIMLTLFLGGYQLTQASACQRRVTIVARAIADLVSQYSLIDATQVATILDASSQILLPYDVAKATSRVSLIRVDATRKVTVVWSEAENTTPRATGAFTALPTAMKIADSYYVFSEVTYDYSPVGGRFAWPLTFTQSMYMVPRKSDAVECSTC